MEYHEIKAFYRRLDRSFFIDHESKNYAHLDQPLPIGFEQTISQPSLVMEMTARLAPEKESRVLEIGTGSGYQTAFLAEFSGAVFTVERIRELSERAKEKLDQLGYKNIWYKVGDGSEGWRENAPFDRIIVTAAAEKIPPELIEQLKPGGKMIIPVGPKGRQELMLITKNYQGEVEQNFLGVVTFVEMKGKYGWKKN